MEGGVGRRQSDSEPEGASPFLALGRTKTSLTELTGCGECFKIHRMFLLIETGYCLGSMGKKSTLTNPH